ncbi:hypothetical protein HK096_008529, partial [Nowakowskiella sp. JEL0078]
MSLVGLARLANNFTFANEHTPLYVYEDFELLQIGLVRQSLVPLCLEHPSVFQIRQANNKQLLILCPEVEDVQTRSTALRNVFLSWRLEIVENENLELIKSVPCLSSLKGWRNEEYSVFGKNGIVLTVERAASGLISVRSYGCHINGYVKSNDEILMWIARRSRSKQTYPGMLDNLVGGGGLPHLQNPFSNMVKEAEEEANLSPDFVKKNLKAVGLITFFLDDNQRGWIPDTEFLYDLELPHDMIPVPKDGEVEEFYLWNLEK